MTKMHYEILDEKRRLLLPKLEYFRTQGFYLAGGTALAFLLGHRDSIDFDFFHEEDIKNTTALFERVTDTLPECKIVKVQEEHNTLGMIIDDTIKLSCMTFRYPLLENRIHTEYMDLASIADIGCMKLNAITGRGAWKDYVDLYFITNTISLADLMKHLKYKMPSIDPMLVLKSLTYFDDLDTEPILFKTTPVRDTTIREELTKRVSQFM